MLRTTVGWSLTFVLVFGGGVACSSTSKDEGTGSGGNGSIVGGGSGGAPSSGAGTTGNGAGNGSGGRITGTAGTGTGACIDDTTITCVDATNASTCNPATGLFETFSCIDDGKPIGIISSGCTKDPVAGDRCALDDFADAPCWDGAQAAAYCENLSDADLFTVYIACFQDRNGLHAAVTCFNDYVTPTMSTAGNCLTAETTCVPGAGGAPADGAGGAPADAAGGAGGAP